MSVALYWIKLHVSHLDDPRIARLPDSLWRRHKEMLLLAKDCEDRERPHLNGFIPDLPTAAWRLHIDETVLENDLAQLAPSGLMELRPHPDGGERWFVTSFQATQQRESAVERKRQQRARDARASGDVTTRDNSVTGDVTTPNGDVTRRRKRNREERIEKEGANPSTENNAPVVAANQDVFREFGITLNKTVKAVCADPWVKPEYIRSVCEYVKAKGKGWGLAIHMAQNHDEPPATSPTNGNGKPPVDLSPIDASGTLY